MVVNTEPNIVIPDDRDVHRFLDNSFSPKSLGQGHHEADEMYYQHQVSSPTSPEQCYQYQQARNFTVEYGRPLELLRFKRKSFQVIYNHETANVTIF